MRLTLVAALGLALLAACTGGQAGLAPAKVATSTPAVSAPGSTSPATAMPAAATLAPAVAPSAAATPQASVPTAGVPAGWHVFSDPNAGYSIMLPPGVDVRSGQSKAGIYTARVQFQIPGVTGYQGLVIRVEPNPQHQGLEHLLPRLYALFGQAEAPADLAAQVQALTVDGLSAVKLAGSASDFAIVVPYGDKVYIMSPVHDLAFAAVDPQALDLFYRILGTLRLAR